MSTILGMRGTGSFPTDFKRDDLRAGYVQLMPNGKAALMSVMAMMKKGQANTPKFEWATKPYVDRRGTVTAVYTDALMSSAYAGGGAKGDTVYVKVPEATAKRALQGNQCLLRKNGDPAYDCRGFVLTVQINGANSMVAVRLSEAPSATYDLTAVNVLKVVGNAQPEGSPLPKAMAFDPGKEWNYTQIFMNSLEATRTFLQRRGDDITIDKAELKRQTLEFHMMDMNSAFIWGERDSLIGSNNQELRLMRGALKWLKEGITMDGTLYTGFIDDWTRTTTGLSGTWEAYGEEYFDAVAAEVFKYGSRERLVLCGQGALVAVNKLVRKRDFVFTDKTKTYGLDLIEWKLPSGTFVFKDDPLMNIDACDRNSMLILDPATQMKERVFCETFYVSDDDIKKGKELPVSGAHTWIDGIKEGFVTETSLEFQHPQLGAYLTNVGETQL